MLEGLWIVNFSSNLKMFGSGVLVLEPDKRLLGGDAGFYYIGKYELEGKDIKGELDVIRYDPSHISVFGNLESFHLSFKGKLSEDEFTAIGTVSDFPGLQLNVKGEKKI